MTAASPVACSQSRIHNSWPQSRQKFGAGSPSISAPHPGQNLAGESPTVPPVTYEGPISAANYRLNAVHSGFALETADASASPGTNVQQGAWEGASHQKWTLVALDSGDKHFRIENMASGAVLEVADGSTEDSANVQVGEWSGADHQRWIVEEYQEGHYGVRAVHSGKGLNVAGVSQEDGGDVVQWPYGGEGAGNELWDFEEVARNLNTSPGMVESFEDGNLDGYRGATDMYAVVEDDNAPDGSMILEGDSGFGGSIEGQRIWTSDVDRHIVPGTVWSARIGWDGDNANACVAFGAVDSDSAAEGDAFPFNFIRLYQEGEDDWRLQMYTRDGSKPVAKTIGETDEDAFYDGVTTGVGAATALEDMADADIQLLV
mgnify:CR=1 FL=1